MGTGNIELTPIRVTGPDRTGGLYPAEPEAGRAGIARAGRALRRLGLAAIGLLLALPAAAQERQSERFERQRVAAGEIVSRTLECEGRARMLSGGYRLYNQPTDRVHFMVLGSYPFGDHGWRVDLRNITDRPRALTFRIYVVCD